MASTGSDDGGDRRTVDADGVVRIRKPVSPRRQLAWAAAGLVLLALVWLALDVRRGGGAHHGGTAAKPAGAGPAASRSPSTATPQLAPGDPSAEPGAAEPGTAAPAGADEQPEVFVDQLDPPPGEKTGIHAFPPPGTKPIKGGILVPEDYQLPPGYVRHYQSTDDGEPVQAILMFHPDHRPVDAEGRPIALPADRVVPPELAPPGMPIRMLDAPPVRRDLGRPPAPR